MDLKQSDGGGILQKKGGNSIDLALNDASPQDLGSVLLLSLRPNSTIGREGSARRLALCKDLQAQEHDGAVASERPAQAAPQAQRLDLKQASDSKSDQPPDYAPPPYPPSNNGASRGTAIRHHTNQVIEASKVRARDEVHLLPSFRAIATLTKPLAATNAECTTESQYSIISTTARSSPSMRRTTIAIVPSTVIR